MGQKDIIEKELEDYNDVFADIYNVLVFEDEVIDETRLRDGTTESRYKDDGGMNRDQRRDVMKTYLDKYRMEIAFVGIDNQTQVDKYIPVRVLGYDYGKYRRQVDEKRFPLVPVITLVLNFSNTRWNNYKSLAEIMDIPPEFVPHFQDYKVKVVDVAFLEDKVIDRFTIDFKLVAKFFKDRRLGAESWDDKIQIKHVEAFFDFVAAFTDDPRYQKVNKDLEKIKSKGEKVTMNDPYLDMVLEHRLAQKEAEAEARAEARGEDKFTRLINCLLADGEMDSMKEKLADKEVRAKLYVKYGIEGTAKTDNKEEVSA